MPDLSHTASTQYWHEYRDKSIYRVIMFLESVENWTLDGDTTLEQAIKQLASELDDIKSLDLSKLSHEVAIMRLVANIKTSRGLRLLQALDTSHPGSASKVLMFAEEKSLTNDSVASFFLKRNIAFERLRLLSRAFSLQRLQLITRSLEKEE